MSLKGWVYVISNPGQPGLIKVGYSMKDPELRARKLDGTASPYSHVVEYEVLVPEPRQVEQSAHKKLRRHHANKEWFRCTPEEAVVAIKTVVGGDAITETYKRADRIKAEQLRKEQDAAAEKLRQDLKTREEHERNERERQRQEKELNQAKQAAAEEQLRFEKLAEKEKRKSEIGTPIWVFGGIVLCALVVGPFLFAPPRQSAPQPTAFQVLPETSANNNNPSIGKSPPSQSKQTATLQEKKIVHSTATRAGGVQLLLNKSPSPPSPYSVLPWSYTLELKGRKIYDGGAGETLSIEKENQFKNFDLILLAVSGGVGGTNLGYVAVLIRPDGKTIVVQRADFISYDGTSEISSIGDDDIEINLGYDKGQKRIAQIKNGTLSILVAAPNAVKSISVKDCDAMNEHVFPECARASNYGTCDVRIGDFSNATESWLRLVSNHPSFNSSAFKSLCTQACITKQLPSSAEVRSLVCGI